MPSYLGRNLNVSIILEKQILIFNVILFSISPRSLDWKPKECAAIVMINIVLYSEWCASVKVHPKVCGVDSILIENWILHTNAIGKVGKANGIRFVNKIPKWNECQLQVGLARSKESSDGNEKSFQTKAVKKDQRKTGITVTSNPVNWGS